MRCVRDLLRCHFAFNQSPSVIAKSQGCGRTTVREYIARAKKNNLNWELVESLNDHDLELAMGFKFFERASWLSEVKTMPDWGKVHGELQANKNVTLALLCQEYLEENKRGYQYSQFCEHYRRWTRKLSVVMRQAHKAGEKSFVDYCEGLNLIDKKTGEVIKTQLFVGCLGASSYTFAEAT